MSQRQPLFYLRADSSLQMGGGHVYRCLSLADALRSEGARVVFICRDLPGNLGKLIADSGFSCEMLPAYNESEPFPWQEDVRLSQEAMQETPAALIVDHYSIDAQWEKALSAKSGKILVIDDVANRPHHCTWLLDGGYVAHAEKRYECLVDKNTSLLLGPTYALIRPQFAEARKRLRRHYDDAREVLVYFGSGDQAGSTLRFLQGLRAGQTQISIKILVHEKDPARAAILAAAQALPSVNILPTASDMASLMAAADIFVGSGGMISWERACLGLPSIATTIAGNQVPSTAYLAETGHILYLGPAEGVSPEAYSHALELLLASATMRKLLGESSAKLVDGLGAVRTARTLLGSNISLRLATPADRDSILAWRNHESARANSMNPAPIAPAVHNDWYAKALADPLRALLMAEYEGRAVGHIRFERKLGSECSSLVSIFLDPAWHQRGFGPAILAAGKEWVQKNWPNVTKLEAHIKEGNAPSISAFKRAGYRKAWSAYIAEL